MLQHTSVAIIGAGIGGLALAQALHARNIPFRLFERDASLGARTQGYRVRISEEGISALEYCLPPDRFQKLRRCCAGNRAITGNAPTCHLDGTSATPIIPPFRPGHVATTGKPFALDRSVLRQVLSEDLDDSLSFGMEYQRHEENDDGVLLYFQSDLVVQCHVLVGSDGLWSRVRRQVLPEYRLYDTGGRLVYGKTLLDDNLCTSLCPAVLETPGMTMMRNLQKQGTSCLMEPMRFDHQAEDCLPADYIYWVFFLPRCDPESTDKPAATLAGAELQQYMRSLTEAWHESLRPLFQTTSMSHNRIISAHPDIPTWDERSRVTLIGDAIHAMAPTAAFGATSALQDVKILAEQLFAAAEDGWNTSYLREYERQMRVNGSSAILRSAQGAKITFGMKPFEELSVITPL